MALFRFLHISDLHIGATPEQLGYLPFVKAGFKFSGYSGTATVSSHNEAILEGLALLAWQEGADLDGILITGDLATTGTLGDLQSADEFLHEPCSTLIKYWTINGRPTLNNPENLNIYLIPGNHDRYEGKYLSPAGSNFDAVFSSAGNARWPVGQSAYAIDVLSKDGVFLGLVGGDLSLRSALDINPANPGQIWGAGRAYQDVIDEMVRLTKDIRDSYSPVEVVWLVHFPPQFPNSSPCLPLLDEDRLIQAALSNDINYLLAGHTHEEDRYLIQTGRALYGGKSAEVLCGGTTTEHRLPSSIEPRTAHFLDFTFSANSTCTVTKKTLSWSDAANYWT